MKKRSIVFYGNKVFFNEGISMRLNTAPSETVDVSNATEIEMNELRQNPRSKLLDKFKKIDKGEKL